MTVKLNHYWTIASMHKREYEKFVINEFVPGVNRLGMHTVAGWSVMIGAYSEIIVETVANDLDLLETALRDPGFQQLKASLLNYIRKYKTKVLINTSKKDAYSTDILDDSVKFTQTWDILGDKKAEFDQFTVETYSNFVLNETSPFVGATRGRPWVHVPHSISLQGVICHMLSAFYSIAPKTNDRSAMRITTPLNASIQ